MPAVASAAGTGEIAGHIEEAGSGTPIEGAEACAYELAGGEGQGCAHADADGDYVIEGMPVGEYEVVFPGQACIEESGEEVCERKWAELYFDDVVPGNPTGTPPTVVIVEESQRTGGIDAVLEAFGEMEGTVTSPAGPIADTLVCIDGATRFWTGCATTDDAGLYRFPQLPPGEFVFEFTGLVCNVGAVCPTEEECLAARSCTRPYVPQYYEGLPIFGQGQMTPFPVYSHTVTAGPSVELTAAGSIGGRVTVAALGDPPAVGVRVCAFPATAELRGECATTGENGEYRIEGLATGDWLVRFDSSHEVEGGGTVEPFARQYFEGESEEEAATPIALTAPGARVADASLLVNEPAAPGFATPPVLSGAPNVGSTLDCAPGTWSNYPTALSYSWRRDGVAIPGQAGATYVVAAADEAASLTCVVTIANLAGSVSATSNALSAPRKTTPSPSAPPSPPSKPKEGIASAIGRARATATAILLKLTCSDAGPCSGSLKLKVKKATIGTASFSLAEGATRTIRLKLNRRGLAYLKASIGRVFKVGLSGRGVKSRTVIVSPPPQKP